VEDGDAEAAVGVYVWVPEGADEAEVCELLVYALMQEDGVV
jgi:hypothetical protein